MEKNLINNEFKETFTYIPVRRDALLGQQRGKAVNAFINFAPLSLINWLVLFKNFIPSNQMSSPKISTMFGFFNLV